MRTPCLWRSAWRQHIFHHLTPKGYAAVILANGSMSSTSGGEVLFLDARKLGYMVNRTNKNLSPEDIAKLADTYRAWREGKGYQNTAGFCKSTTLTEIRSHGHVLTPGRYVGAEDVEDDGESFEEKMPRLAAALRERFAKRAGLEKKVKANLEGMGYGG
jgi:type I restriction enzyme M protein